MIACGSAVLCISWTAVAAAGRHDPVVDRKRSAVGSADAQAPETPDTHPDPAAPNQPVSPLAEHPRLATPPRHIARPQRYRPRAATPTRARPLRESRMWPDAKCTQADLP
jgi:hypothetical protein